MVRTPSCDKSGLKKGTWTPEEDQKLIAYVTRYGCWNWRHIPRFAGLARCGKSCRLRWLNYLRPDIKRGNYTEEEEEMIIRLHEKLGNKWSIIATQLPGRTDNEIKNHWHTALKKRFGKDGVTNKNVKATKLNDLGPKHKQGMDSVQNNVSSPTTTSVLDANTEDVNKWTESYLTDICHSPIEIVPDIGNDNFQGSDITCTQDAWNLSPLSSSSEILVPEKDNFAFLEIIESTTANFWTEPTPYIADMSHVPNELLIPLVNDSDEYFSAMYDADLWSQNNSHDLHVSLFQ